MLAILLKEKCQKLELSSRQAAEKVGVSHATILRAFRGDLVDQATLIKISNWLKVKPATLLNSLSSTSDVLTDKIAVVLERHPQLMEIFVKALDEVVNRKMDTAIIEDIAAYAAYKINLSSSRL
jgi:transcriptional regulator with XRE-family HTH domain